MKLLTFMAISKRENGLLRNYRASNSFVERNCRVTLQATILFIRALYVTPSTVRPLTCEARCFTPAKRLCAICYSEKENLVYSIGSHRLTIFQICCRTSFSISSSIGSADSSSDISSVFSESPLSVNNSIIVRLIHCRAFATWSSQSAFEEACS